MYDERPCQRSNCATHIKTVIALKKKIDWGNNIGKCVLAGNEEINVMNCIQGTTRAY